MKKNFAALIKIKSIITLALVLVFCILSLRGIIPTDEFLKILTIIIVFYFAKNKGDNIT